MITLVQKYLILNLKFLGGQINWTIILGPKNSGGMIIPLGWRECWVLKFRERENVQMIIHWKQDECSIKMCHKPQHLEHTFVMWQSAFNDRTLAFQKSCEKCWTSPIEILTSRIHSSGN